MDCCFNFLNWGIERNEKPSWWSDSQVATHNESTIKAIKHYNRNNIPVNLFIGRIPNEPLPSNGLWVSLSNERSNEFLSCLDKNRLHLIMDCNVTSQMEVINNLFNQVVVDLSTRKFFKDVGLANMYKAVKTGGELLIEVHLEGGAFNIDDQVCLNLFTYNENFQEFVVNFFQDQFQIHLDFSNCSGHFMYDKQIADHKQLVTNLQSYKDWKKEQEQDHDFNEMLYFFEHLAEQNGLVSPINALERKLYQQEIETRTKEMSEYFNDVKLLKEHYPYKNNYDRNGTIKTQYFHAKGKV